MLEHNPWHQTGDKLLEEQSMMTWFIDTSPGLNELIALILFYLHKQSKGVQSSFNQAWSQSARNYSRSMGMYVS